MSQTIPEKWFDADLAVVDVETTGLNSKVDRVIEIGIIFMRQGEVVESWGQLFDPGIPIPEDVVKLTGITQDDVNGKPSFDSLAADIRTRLEGKVLVAYNLSFDRGFIQSEFERSGISWADGPALDPLVFAREFIKQGSKRLGVVAERLGIELVEAHRATFDAEVAGRILYAFRDKLPERLEDLITLQQQWAKRQEQKMAAWRKRRGRGDESSDDTPVSQATPQLEPQGSQDIVLGPAYIYGDDPDPVRFFYKQLPDAGTRR
jgi:DNA polymerase III epsilon subunit family exonuclease